MIEPLIVVASRNEHKVGEIAQLPAAQDLVLRSIGQFAGCPEVAEDGTTIEENAVLKATRYSLWLKREHNRWPLVIAEDAGLLIDALLGWPGVASARVAATDAERIALVLGKLGEMTDRGARFTAVTALAVNGNFVKMWQGTAYGRITAAPRGAGGFGYDPIFEDVTVDRTFAELSLAEKNQRSHRAKAWTKALEHARIMLARAEAD